MHRYGEECVEQGHVYDPAPMPMKWAAMANRRPLPREELVSGMAEVVEYGVAVDPPSIFRGGVK